MIIVNTFLKKRWSKKCDNFLKKSQYYYSLFQKEIEKKSTFPSTTYIIDGEEITITNYTAHVPFFIHVNAETKSLKYYEKFLYFSRKFYKYQNKLLKLHS